MTFVADVGMLVMLAALVLLLYNTVMYKMKAQSLYENTKYAYKTGLIHKHAKVNEVELIFPTAEDKFLARIDEEVEEDISSAGE